MMGRRILALGVLVTSWGLALASIVIAWIFELPELPVPGAFLSASPPLVQSRFDEIGVVVALIYGLLSAVLIVRRPHPVVIVLAVHAVGSGIAAFGVQWGLLGERIPGLPLWGLLAHAAGWGYVPGTVGTVIVPVILLRKPLGAAGWTVVVTVAGLATASGLAALVHQAPVDATTGGPINPLAIPDAGVQAALPWVYGVAVVLAVLISIGVAVWVVVQWRDAATDRRARVGWLTVGHAFLTLSYAALVVPAGPEVPALVWDFGMIAPVIGQIFYPSAVLVLVLGTRLRGIDIAVTRVLLWTILTVAAITAYLIVSELLATVTPLDPVAVGILSAAIVAIPLQAARRGIELGIDRLVYGPDGDPARLLASLGERVGEFDSGAEGLVGLAVALRSALGVAAVEIVPDDESAAPIVVGTPGSTAVSVELRAAGVRLGEIRVYARPGERLAGSVRRNLEGLAGVVAIALRLALASARLGAARDALVAARQDERRALRRELHDGIGPSLAGVGFGLAAVDNLRASDPAAAGALASRLADDLREQLGEVRRVARTVRADRAVFELSVELAELAADFAGSGVEVRVDAPASWRVPAPAIRPLYLVAAEAVHNAVRHAQAALVEIELIEDADGAVALIVRDDGRGFDPGGVAGGVGLTTMREHAAEAGGALDLRSGPSGTTILIRVPASAVASTTALETTA
ncbi:MAG: sensor histidine kinase [Protaetiibacter sp.]